VRTGLDGRQDLDAAAAVARERLLDRLDRARTLGQRRPGHDAHRLAGGHGARGPLARPHLADDDERTGHGHVGGAQRVAVHRGAVERRQVGVGEDVLGQHAADGVGERHSLGRQRARLAKHERERRGDGDHARDCMR
jgi:hypothetical protein